MDEATLIQRLLFLAQEAVKAAIDEHFDDPDDYFICRELAELEPLAAKALKEPSADLAGWSRPAIKPVPVSERPWEREGWCDAEGKCWICGNVEGDWRLMNPRKVSWLKYCFSHSLPHHALPVPKVTP